MRRRSSRVRHGSELVPQPVEPRPDYTHLPSAPSRESWIATSDVNPPHEGPRRFAYSDDMFLIERFIGIG